MRYSANGITFPDSTVQTTAYTGGGGFVTSVSAPLSVTSGDLSVDLTSYATVSSPTFTGGINVEATGLTNIDYELIGTGLGVKLHSDATQLSTLTYNSLAISPGGMSPAIMYVTTTGLTFPDATSQATSATNLGYISQGTADGLYYSISNPSGFTSFSGTDAISAITGGSTSNISGNATISGQVLTYNGSQIYWNAGLSAPTQTNAVWAYGGWYSANATGIYDGYMNYYTVLTF